MKLFPKVSEFLSRHEFVADVQRDIQRAAPGKTISPLSGGDIIPKIPDRMLFLLLINVVIITVVCILTFINGKHFLLN